MYLRDWWIFRNIVTDKGISPFKRQPYKIVQKTQAIRRLLSTNCLSVFNHFMGFTLKGLRKFFKMLL